MRDRLLGGRIRTSTVILALLFIVTLVVYLLVRPVPAGVTEGRQPPAGRSSTTTSAPPQPTPSPTTTRPRPRTPAPTATQTAPHPTPTTTPSPSSTPTAGVSSPTP